MKMKTTTKKSGQAGMPTRPAKAKLQSNSLSPKSFGMDPKAIKLKSPKLMNVKGGGY
jgi:hypothetical protein